MKTFFDKNTKKLIINILILLLPVILYIVYSYENLTTSLNKLNQGVASSYTVSCSKKTNTCEFTINYLIGKHIEQIDISQIKHVELDTEVTSRNNSKHTYYSFKYNILIKSNFNKDDKLIKYNLDNSTELQKIIDNLNSFIKNTNEENFSAKIENYAVFCFIVFILSMMLILPLAIIFQSIKISISS